MKSKLLLFLAIIMGVLTTYLFYTYMQDIDVQTAVNESMVDIVVAKDEIKENQRISSDMLELVQIPESALHPQAIQDPSKIEGMYVTSELAAGESILTHRLQDEQDEALFVSRKVREGYRAVSVGLNIVQSVSNLIEPEDYVDVIFSEVLKTPGEQEQIRTELILSKVRVLAVGRRMSEAHPEKEYVQYSSVTLELSAQESVTFVNASERGNIQLVLHSRVIQPKEELADATEPK